MLATTLAGKNTSNNFIYNYNASNESILSLIKIFGNCSQKNREDDLQCQKIQSVVKKFLGTFLIDLCITSKRQLEKNSIDWMKCGMATVDGENISLLARIQPRMFWMRDLNLNLNLECETLEHLDSKIGKNHSFSLLCNVNNRIFLSWPNQKHFTCQTCDDDSMYGYKKSWKLSQLDCSNKTPTNIDLCLKKADFDKKLRDTCSKQFNSNCFEEGLVDLITYQGLLDFSSFAQPQKKR